MSLTGALVMFATTFFLILFLLLPWRHRSQEEAGQVVPGTPVGAPDDPRLGRKALVAAALAAVLVLVIWWALGQGWVTRHDLMNFNRP